MVSDPFGKELAKSGPMSTREVTQDQILGALHGLEPERWPKVLAFIEYLTISQPQSQRWQLTARDLLQSGLVGLWADREDIKDSLEFAQRLRRQAEHRGSSSNDLA
jgi:hypothetical protein